MKGVSFMGARDEYVVSGSDCGHIFIWDVASGKLRMLLKVRPPPAKHFAQN